VSRRCFSLERHDDHGASRRPSGEVDLVAIALRDAEPHDTVREVVLGVRHRQDVATQDSHDAAAELVAADEELDLAQLDTEQPGPV
jgi:hypothetical protein